MSDETTTDTLAEIEGQPEPQPVQVCEGRWRTRGGKEISVTAMPTDHTMYLPGYPWWDGDVETWKNDGGYYKNGEALEDLVKYLGPIEPEPGQIITPDDVAAEAEASPVLQQVMIEAQAETIARLNSEINALNTENVELQIQVESLNGRLQEQTAKSAKRLEHVKELRNEVSYVQGLLGEEKRRFAELETLTSDLRAVNSAQEKAMNSAARENADLQNRLRAVAAEFGVQLETHHGLQTQLEAVKAELVQVSKDRHALQVELDAREQVPEAVSDRFDQGFEHGKARAVETIAEWIEPFRQMTEKADNLVESDRASRLCAEIMQNLPHIMRTLTGLADTED